MLLFKSQTFLRQLWPKCRQHLRPNYGNNFLRCSSTSIASSKPSYLHYLGKEPLIFSTIGKELERVASDFGSTEAIVSCHENKRYTFRSLLEQVDRLAAGLQKLGLKQGDAVGIWGPNSMDWYISMMAIARAGMIFVGINPAFQAPELEYCLNKVAIKALITPETYKTQNYYELLCSICSELAKSENGQVKSQRVPHLQNVIVSADTRLPGTWRFDDVLNMASLDEIKQVGKMQNSIEPDSACNIQFTSGTTGNPKAAMLSHFSYVNNAKILGARNQLKWQRMCALVPLFHAFGVVIVSMAALMHSSTVVLPAPGFNTEASLKAIVAENCTGVCGTPTMFVDLIQKQKQLQLPLAVKLALTGGAPCTPKLFTDMREVLGVQELRNIYGLTESTSTVFQSLPHESMDKILNTVGHLHEHVEAKVIDANGKTVPFGQPGELCLRGYVTMLGYHDDEAKTKQTITADKWLRTGDQFILQEDGYGRIVGRIKDMIIRGGENIYPKEIEDFLNTHENIAETQVIGVADERMGEEVCAFVRLQGKNNINRDEIKEFCKGKLAHFKVPRYVLPVAEFPKTTSGKIQKFKLKEMFENEFNKKN